MSCGIAELIDSVVPSPFLFEFVTDEGDAPAGFGVDAFEDLDDFFLFTAVVKELAGDGEAAYRG